MHAVEHVAGGGLVDARSVAAQLALGLVVDAAAELVLGAADEHELAPGALEVARHGAAHVGDHRHRRDQDAAGDADRPLTCVELVVE